MDPRRLLGNNASMMTLSFITALALGGFPSWFPLTNGNVAMLMLVIMMSFSLTSLRIRGMSIRSHSKAILRATLLSFVLSSGVTIALAQLFQGDIRAGWVLLAAVPSAVSVVPFTFLMKGDLEPTLISTAALYIIAVALTPLLTLLFLGQAVDVLLLVFYVAVLILLPLLLSIGIKKLDIPPSDRTAIINVAFFILIVAVAGSNRHVFFGEPLLLLSLLGVAVVRIMGVGLAWDWHLRRRGASRAQRVPEVLFSSYKNTGMAAALAMSVVGPQAAVPAAVCTVVDIVWLIYLSRFLFSDARVEDKQAPIEISEAS
ncbi:MAG: hypothetical protein QW520_02500 [Methanomassiliicoccales archaeon]